MARLNPSRIPQHVLDDPARAAEVRFYEALQRDLSDDYVVFYGVAWILPRKRQEPRDCEIDFIVGHRRKGILVIEVKGGGISFNGPDGQWFSKDRAGKLHKIMDPVEQARRNKYGLRDKLRSLPSVTGEPHALGHAVAFPDTSDPGHDLKTDLARPMTIYSDDMGWLHEKLESTFSFWAGRSSLDERCLAETLTVMERSLAPSFELRTTLGADLRRDDQRLLHLTEDQFRVLDLLSRQPRAAISGGAGTGKSLLALEKARRLAGDGHNTLLTCFNRLLADQLAHSASDLPNLTVNTFHGFCEKTAQQAGVVIPEHPPMKAPPAFFSTELPQALEQALDHLPDYRFDAVVVDEGQDFRSDWWVLLEMAQSQPGESIFYIFYDDNQNIFRTSMALPEGLQQFPLSDNLRNTQAIHQLAMRFYRGELRCSGAAGQSPEFIAAADARKTQRELSRTLHRLVNDEKISSSEIVILTGKSLRKSTLAGCEKLGAFKLTKDLQDGSGAVLAESIHRFKGLDRQVAILTDLGAILLNDKMLEARRNELVYVALTRARGHLIIIDGEEVGARLGLTG